MDPTFAELLDLQSGVISRSQLLAGGASANDVRRLLRRPELVLLHPGVYLTHTGDPTWLQRAWAAVLFASPAALCGTSALRAADGPGRRDGEEGPIHVAIERARHRPDIPGVRLHRRTSLEERVLWNASPPRMRYDEAALDVALAAQTELAAIGALAKACQSRRTTASRLLETLAARPRAPRRVWLKDVLTDIAEGTCSVLEHGYLQRVERPHGLPSAERQQRSRISVGVIYRDVAYKTQIVELDGRLFHDTAAGRDSDFERNLDAAVDGRDTVRISWGTGVRAAVHDGVQDRAAAPEARLGRRDQALRTGMRRVRVSAGLAVRGAAVPP